MDTRALNAALLAAVNRGIAPGMVLGTRQGDDGPHLMVAGSATLIPTPQPMRPETIFDLASLTKVFATTLLAMRMTESGQLALDTPLGQLVPGLYAGRIAQLTPRLLLVHAAGLPSSIPFFKSQSPQAPPTDAHREAVLEEIRRTELVYAPGTETRYSDVGMILLGDVVEHLSRERLDVIFEQQIARPLGLEDTFYRHLADPLPRAQRPPEAFAATERCPWRGTLVRGWVHDENAYALGGVAGHAGLFSTAADLLVLCTAILDAWHGREGFLKPATVRTFVRRQNAVPGSDRALGWATFSPGASCGTLFSSQAFGHTGFTGTSAWLDPQPERVVVLLANRVHPTRNNDAFLRFRPELHDQVVRAFIGTIQ